MAGRTADDPAVRATALCDLLPRCAVRDRPRLQNAVERLPRRPDPREIERLEGQVQASVAWVEARRASVPTVRYDGTLPVHLRRDDIAQAIRDSQVVIVSGATGSGKSTQLPKICLELGRGAAGMIGHTQPRRIAAQALANRISAELGSVTATSWVTRCASSTGPARALSSSS